MCAALDLCILYCIVLCDVCAVLLEPEFETNVSILSESLVQQQTETNEYAMSQVAMVTKFDFSNTFLVFLS